MTYFLSCRRSRSSKSLRYAASLKLSTQIALTCFYMSYVRKNTRADIMDRVMHVNLKQMKKLFEELITEMWIHSMGAQCVHVDV